MSFFSALFLGFVQGVAEFLPISSSGHLSVFQNFLGLMNAEEENLFFDVLLHLGTLAAVFAAYWSEIKTLVQEGMTMVGLRRLPRGEKPDRLNRRMIFFLIVATLPLLLVIPIKDKVENLYSNTFFIGGAFLLTGTILFLSDRMSRGGKELRSATIVDVLLIGLGQAIAVVPGLSRSGTTISCGMSRGFSREFAVKFSFLMSIPAVLGANILTLIDAIKAGVDWSLMPLYLVGMISAAVFGYLAIWLLQIVTRKGNFGGFCYYCWGAGLVTLILSLMNH